MYNLRVSRGLKLILTRKSPKRPVHVEVIEESALTANVDAFFWLSPLMAIFGLPALREEESFDDYSVRVKPTVKSRLDFVARSIMEGKKTGVAGRSTSKERV
jgi:hypothetical protein